MPPTNMILIQSDQHRYDCVGVNGHPLLQTPNLDRLAAEGVNFTSAYCPCPLCSPARASLLTGQWPTEHGLITNPDTEAGHGFLPGRTTYSQELSQAGYALGYVGKWHAHSDLGPTDFGFKPYIPLSAYDPWRAEQGLSPWPFDWKQSVGANGEQRYSWFGGTDHAITAAQSRLAWGADVLIRLLRDCADRQQPFFLRWDPVEPHLPNIVPEPWASLYRPTEIAPWGSFGDEFARKPFIQRQQLHSWGLQDWTWDDWAPIVARYLGEISLLDAQIGRVMQALDELGRAEDTLLIYTSDHGDMCGSHGMIDKHYIMYDDVVRVPLIARWPAGIPAGQTCDAFVSNAIDLATTFCELGSVPVPESMRGSSLQTLWNGNGAALKDRPDIFSTYHGNQFGLYSQRMVRDRRWKYVWNATAPDELYDLHSDPWELDNRNHDPACLGERQRLQQRMLAWMEETRDALLNTWTHRYLREDLTAP